MAESTLTIDYAYFRRELGREFYGQRTPGSLSADQQTDVDDFIFAGQRLFYNPPMIGRQKAPHNWSFKWIFTTISTVAEYSTGTVAISSGVVTLTGGTWPSWAADGELTVNNITYEVSTRDSNSQITLVDTSSAADTAAGTSYNLSQPWYDLPDDFGGITGPLAYRPGQSLYYPPPEHVDPQQINILRQRYEYTDRPAQYAIRPKALDMTTGQRWQIGFYPVPDDVYQFRYPYESVGEKLTSSNKYPHGGAQHSETILAACMAAGELRLNDEKGVHWQNFIELLTASVAKDVDATTPDTIGYDRDAKETSFDGDDGVRSYGWFDLTEYEGHTLYTG